MTSEAQTLCLPLAPHPASVGESRRFLRDALRTTQLEEFTETAELLVSEVVSNALMHAGTEVEVVVTLDGLVVRVEVLDGSPHLPSTKSYHSLTATGRGLHLLEELGDRWGVDRRDTGKSVWFELGGAGSEVERGRAQVPIPVQGPRVDPADTIVVELLNVPLLLHAAWQMQSESLLREYLLSQLDDTDDIEAMERHAAAADALTLLRVQIPEPDLGEDPEAIMATAVEPRTSVPRVLVTVPLSSVPHFELLREVLSTAVAMADEGVLLTPPTQPEVQALRGWLCAEVRRQATGIAATPWDGDCALAEPARLPADWDSRVVSKAGVGMIAADDTNRILAVSPVALEILGYRNPGELVWDRLTVIIPSRYRQAHVAGFTLHLFAGRSPLLGTPVTVPAVRRDGSEVLVRLTVNALHLPEGRRVFIAEVERAPDSSAG